MTTFVYDNALLYDNARMYNKATLYGNAIMRDNTLLYDNAIMRDNAIMLHNAIMRDNAILHDKAILHDRMQLRGDALVGSQEDVCYFAGFGSEYRVTTAHIDSVIGIRINCGCFTGSVADFRAAILKIHHDTNMARIYFMMADMIELRLAHGIKE